MGTSERARIHKHTSTPDKPRQDQIQQDQIHRVFLKAGHGLVAVLGFADGVPAFDQVDPDQLANVGVIFDDEDIPHALLFLSGGILHTR